MQNIKMTVAYDGGNYLGWQKTAMGKSIEAELQKVLEQILQEPISLQAASRTDAGVHAQGQVVNFFTSKLDLNTHRLLVSINSLLPHDIAVLKIDTALQEFHPTLDCKEKEYHYFICMGIAQLPQFRHYSWHCAGDLLDINEMQQACSHIVGTRDFAALCNQKHNEFYQNTIRTVNALSITELVDNRLQLVVRGQHFLYKMVRNIAGLLVYVGRHKIKADDVPQIVSGLDREKAAVTAPAHGLTLFKVVY